MQTKESALAAYESDLTEMMERAKVSRAKAEEVWAEAHPESLSTTIPF